MTKTWIQPKLVMGHLEVVGPDDEVAIPYDEAVIHLEGDEDSEIEVRCPGALRLAPIIVKAVNGYEDTQELLVDIWFHFSATDDATLRGIADRARDLLLDPVEGVAK